MRLELELGSSSARRIRSKICFDPSSISHRIGFSLLLWLCPMDGRVTHLHRNSGIFWLPVRKTKASHREPRAGRRPARRTGTCTFSCSFLSFFLGSWESLACVWKRERRLVELAVWSMVRWLCSVVTTVLCGQIFSFAFPVWGRLIPKRENFWVSRQCLTRCREGFSNTNYKTNFRTHLETARRIFWGLWPHH